jgi:hypothetical protein
MSEEQNIVDTVLESAEKLEAAFLVATSFESVKTHLMRKLETDIRNKATAKGFLIESEREFYIGRRWTELVILFDSRQFYRLVFGFDRNGYGDFFWGIQGRTKSGQKHELVCEEVRNIMTKLFGVETDKIFDSDHVSCWYLYANGIIFDTELRHWLSSPKPWQAIRDGTLPDTMLEIADKVHHAFKDHMDLLMPESSSDVTVQTVP